MNLSATLVSDGSSDATLKPILEWLFREHLPVYSSFSVTVADLRGLRNPPKRPVDKLRVAWEQYPADVLFLHRDAEEAPHKSRSEEADALVKQAFQTPPPYIKVIPVKMTEAWLLGDEAAIRQAAGNPSGKQPLQLPVGRRVEGIHAKDVLFDALRVASGLNARRLGSFNVHQQRHRLADLMLERGFAHLRILDSFLALEADVIRLIEQRAV